MKLKPKTYYKRYYKGDWYAIYYTGNKWGYKIASKYNNNPLVKCKEKTRWKSIKKWQKEINDFGIKIEEISKEDLFLELL